MKEVKPLVFLVGETCVCRDGLDRFLNHIGASGWSSNGPFSDSEELVEVMGRLCYKSFGTGLNKNLTKVRDNNVDYVKNILDTGHGSVLEHSFLNFIFADVSRVVTHELCRHRTGTAISQESLRFVRLEELSYYVPVCIRENEALTEVFVKTVSSLEEIQKALSSTVDESSSFSVKKALTSAFRRLAPSGVATNIGWSCNIRELRHVISLRTDPSSEEEIRYLFSLVFDLVKIKYPCFFADFYVRDVVDGIPWLESKNKKV